MSQPKGKPVTGVRTTNSPAIKNAPFPAEGNGSFSNLMMGMAVVVVPYVLKRWLPFVKRGGFLTYLILLVVTANPTIIVYWAIMSRIGQRKNEKLNFPGKPVETYITFLDPVLKEKYGGRANRKIPIQEAHDAYFDGRLKFNGASTLFFLKALAFPHC